MKRTPSKAITDVSLHEIAEMFSALSNPHRLQIFLGLARCCVPLKKSTEFEARRCVSDAGKGLDISPSTLSHHIKELRRVGLIQMEKSGQTTDCWVEPKTLKKLQSLLNGISAC
jgi:ArsR family transcriptional regulator, arsenate/arsenite/antimonite-responsive transcriptional repressor